MFLYVLPLLVSAALGLILALFILRNRLATGARALLILMLGASLWSLGYALELLSPDLETKLFWAKFQYFGIVTAPIAWYIFSVQHLGTPGWSERSLQYRTFLWIIPILTLCLVWTNDAHRLVWRTMQLQDSPVFQLLQIEHGAWFWVYLVYSYSLMLLGTVRLVRSLLGSIRYHRWQMRLMLVASVLPWLGNISYITHLNPISHLDWTPFTFTIAGLLFTISLFRFQMVNILPIAQKAIFSGLADCVFVLDLKDCIIDLNASAQAVLGEAGKGALGSPLIQVLPELAPWIERAGFAHEFSVEIARGTGPDQRFYDLHIAPIRGSYPQPIGRMVSLHEITSLKQEQARLVQDRDDLEQVIAERTETLRLTIEQLQHELTERTLAEKRFEKVVELAPDAMLLLDEEARIILINAQAEELFGYQRHELAGSSIKKLIPLHRRDSDHRALQRYLTNPTTREVSFGLDLRGMRKDGSEFPIEISLGPLHTGGGFWVACNVRDISERIKAEQAQKRLVEEIKQSHAQLRALTMRLQQVQEFERRQIATELHDRVGQNLTGLNLSLQLIGNLLPPGSQDQIRSRLADSIKLVEETTRQVRDVMADLHPLVLEEHGLVSALHWYGDNFTQRTGIMTRVTGAEFQPRLPSNIEMVLFRLVQEALNNAAKHARASQVMITVESSPDVINIIVEDNGQGFDTKELNPPEGQPHYGLIHMRQRAASIGGELVIDTAPSLGTRVLIRVWRHPVDD